MTYLDDAPTLDELAAAFGLDRQQCSEYHAYGNVKSVDSDGKYQVQLNASSVLTTCARCCTAEVGDRVLVVVGRDGRCAAVGRVGGLPAADYVVEEKRIESGERDVWVVRKWKSGYCEAETAAYYATCYITHTYGALYYHDGGPWPFPGDFTEVYGMTASDNTGGGLTTVKCHSIDVQAHTYRVYVFDSVSQTADKTLHVRVTGRWK